MRILITKQQHLILEQTSGIDDFLTKVVEGYPIMSDHIDKLRRDIEQTGCKKIELSPLRQALGAALSSGVIISDWVFKLPLGDFIFVLFHELAHQYQFKKYGAEKMIGLYRNDVSISDASEWMLTAEKVADEFAIRKVREYVKLGALSDAKLASNMSQRQNMTSIQMAYMIKMIRQSIRLDGTETLDQISEKLYNFIKQYM